MEHPKSPTNYLDRDLPPLPSLATPQVPRPLHTRKPSRELLPSTSQSSQWKSHLPTYRTPSPRPRRSGTITGSTPNHFLPRSDPITPIIARNTTSTPRRQPQYRGNTVSAASSSDASSSIFGHFRALSPNKRPRVKETVDDWLGEMANTSPGESQQSPERQKSLEAVAQVRDIFRSNPLQEDFPRLYREQLDPFRTSSESGYQQSNITSSEIGASQGEVKGNNAIYSLPSFQASCSRSQSRLRESAFQALEGQSPFDTSESSMANASHQDVPVMYEPENRTQRSSSFNIDSDRIGREDSCLTGLGKMPSIVEVYTPALSQQAQIENESYRTLSPSSVYPIDESGCGIAESPEHADNRFAIDDYHHALREESNVAPIDSELNLDEYHKTLRKQAQQTKKSGMVKPKENQPPTRSKKSANQDMSISKHNYETPRRRSSQYYQPSTTTSLRPESPQGSQIPLRLRSPFRSPTEPSSIHSDGGVVRVQYDIDEQALRSVIQNNPEILGAVNPVISQGPLGFPLPPSANTGSFGRSTVVVDIPESPIPPRTRSPMKEMFGPRGWLGMTASPMIEESKEKYRRRGFGDKIKELSEKAGLSPKKASAPFPIHVHQNVTISVTRDKQAAMYMELELCLCTTANNFLMVQLRSGRIGEIVARQAAEWWRTKGRMDVVEFQYDQATQRDIIVAHQKKMQFYGQNSYNAIRRNTVLASWKTLAKDMSIRNFCTPDHILDRQLQDAYTVLEMIGATAEILTSVGEMTAFLNNQIVVKRESSGRPGVLTNSPPLLWDPESPFLSCMGQPTPAPFTPKQGSNLRNEMTVDAILNSATRDLAPGHKGFSKWRKHLKI